MARRMSDQQIRDFLSEGRRTGKLATVRRDGSPHVVPVWFVLDGPDLLFTVPGQSVKARAMRRDPRVALSVDLQEPPYAFVEVVGQVSISADLEDMLPVATAIGARYMGAELAEQFGRRNAVAGELLVRLRPERYVAFADIAG